MSDEKELYPNVPDKILSKSREELLSLLQDICKDLKGADDATDFCIGLAEKLEVDIRSRC